MNRSADIPLPAPRRTRADQVADAIRADIISHALAPGLTLRQEDLAARYRVSRIPLREALRRLESEGLVDIHPFRGATVATLSDDRAREIIELRVLLMQHALRLAVPRMTEADLARAAAALEAARLAGDLATWGRRIDDFYTALCAPSGRPRLLALLHDLHNQSQRYRVRVYVNPALRDLFREGMHELLEHCRRRDAEAAVLSLDGYMRDGLARFLAQLASGPSEG